jgi:hypothetical protein
MLFGASDDLVVTAGVRAEARRDVLGYLVRRRRQAYYPDLRALAHLNSRDRVSL